MEERYRINTCEKVTYPLLATLMALTPLIKVPWENLHQLLSINAPSHSRFHRTKALLERRLSSSSSNFSKDLTRSKGRLASSSQPRKSLIKSSQPETLSLVSMMKMNLLITIKTSVRTKAKATRAKSVTVMSVTTSSSYTTTNLLIVTRSAKVDPFHTDREQVQDLSRTHQTAHYKLFQPPVMVPMSNKFKRMRSAILSLNCHLQPISTKCLSITIRPLRKDLTKGIPTQARETWLRVTRRQMETFQTLAVALAGEPLWE